MSARQSVFDNLQVATPCPARWDDMDGDERVRHCSACGLHVYNFSNLSRGEAQDLVQTSEGRLCVRLYRRADGSVLSQDCPFRQRVPAPRTWKRAGVLCSFVFFILGAITLIAIAKDSSTRRVTDLPGVQRVLRWFGWQPPRDECVMGKMVMPRQNLAAPPQEGVDPLP